MNAIIKGMPSREYFKSLGVSKSSLDEFAKSPSHYRDFIRGESVQEVTPAMEYGSVLHAALLESRQEYHIKPDSYETKDGPKPFSANSTWCKQWLAGHSDKPCITRDEHNWIARALDAICSNSLAFELIKCGDSEVSLFGTDADTNLQLKGRADKWCQSSGFITDLKTCQLADTRSASKMVTRYRYHVQAAMYSRIIEINGLDCKGFYFIFLEKSDPPRINVRLLKQTAVDLGSVILDKQLSELAHCLKADVWPGYNSTEPGAIDLIDVEQWCYSLNDNPLTSLTIGGEAVQL